jgi:hypothetical protein
VGRVGREGKEVCFCVFEYTKQSNTLLDIHAFFVGNCINVYSLSGGA